MSKASLIVSTLALIICLAAPNVTFAQAPTRSGYESVNDLKMYYEIHGKETDKPKLVLLHGAMMTIEGFGELLPSLAQSRPVVVVEQQAHGRTADIDRPLSYE